MSSEDDEILQAFIEESVEHLADIENDLLAIEKRGADIDEDLVNKVFRAAHSIKGGAGFMGLAVIQDLAHVAENVLGLIRSRRLTPTPGVVNALLLAADELQHLLTNIDASNAADISRHVTALNAIASGEQPTETAVKQPAVPTHPPELPSQSISPEAAAPVPLPEEPEEPSLTVAPGTMAPTGESHSGLGDASIRVSVNLLDQLMNLAGELVLSRNQIGRAHV